MCRQKDGKIRPWQTFDDTMQWIRPATYTAKYEKVIMSSMMKSTVYIVNQNLESQP